MSWCRTRPPGSDFRSGNLHHCHPSSAGPSTDSHPSWRPKAMKDFRPTWQGESSFRLTRWGRLLADVEGERRGDVEVRPWGLGESGSRPTWLDESGFRPGRWGRLPAAAAGGVGVSGAGAWGCVRGVGREWLSSNVAGPGSAADVEPGHGI